MLTKRGEVQAFPTSQLEADENSISKYELKSDLDDGGFGDYRRLTKLITAVIRILRKFSARIRPMAWSINPSYTLSSER